MFNISYWLWRLNPSAAVPAMIISAVDIVKQSAVVTIFVATISRLASAGILEQLAEALASGDAFALLRIIAAPPLFSSIVWGAATAIALYCTISIVGGGLTNSAEFGSYLQLLRTGELSISDVVEKAGGRWLDMAWTVAITEAMKYGPLAATLIWIVSSAVNQFKTGFAEFYEATFLWLAVLLLVGLFTIVVLVLTVYAYPAAANGAYGLAAVRQSVGVCRAFPGETIFYALLKVLSFVAMSAISYAAGLLSVQVSSVAAALVGFIITPILHILKTAIFLRKEPVIIPLPVGPAIIEDAPRYIWRSATEKIRIGMSELVIFLLSPGNLPYHLLSTGAFIVGVIAGGQISSLGLGQLLYALGYKPGRVNPDFRGIALPFLAVDLSFHNWQVSLATALSGLALFVPTLITMMFNGFILGLVGSLVPNLTMFLAAILPHGIIELPSFIAAGSVGMSLAFRFAKALTRGGASSDKEVHRATRQAIYVILGLVPFFIIAGMIEAFITPFVMRFYGWE